MGSSMYLKPGPLLLPPFPSSSTLPPRPPNRLEPPTYIPADFSHHQHELIKQSLITAEVSNPAEWESSLIEAIQSIPVMEWVEGLAQTAQYRSSGPSSLTSSLTSVGAVPSETDRTAESVSNLSYLKSIPTFTPYPPPLHFEIDHDEDALYPSARRHHPPPSEDAPPPVPGAFNFHSQTQNNLGRTSLDSVVTISSTQPAGLADSPSRNNLLAPTSDIKLPDLSGDLVLCICLWVGHNTGDRKRIDWVPYKYALPELELVSGDSESACSVCEEESDSPSSNVVKMVQDENSGDEKKLPATRPKDDTASSGKVLIGLDHLSTSQPASNQTLVGGTLLLLGCPTPEDLVAIENVIRIALYTHLSNALEVHILASHSRPLQPPLIRPSLFATFSERSSEPPNSPLSPTFTVDEDPTGLSRMRKRVLKGWGFLTRVGEGLSGSHHNTTSFRKRRHKGDGNKDDNRVGLGLGRVTSPDNPASSSPQVISFSTSSSTSAASSNASMTANLTTPTSGASTPTPSVSLDKFTNAVRSIESTILSTSPYVVFPPPALLVRLRETEARANQAPIASTSGYNTRLDASAVAVEFGRGGAGVGGSSTGSGFQKTATAETSTTDSTIMGTDDRGKDKERERYGMVAPEGLRLTGEARVGMQSLMVGNGTLEAFGRHQSISVLYHQTISSSVSYRSHSPSPTLSPNGSPKPSSAAELSEESTTDTSAPSCAPPHWKTFSYFGDSPSSPSIGTLIRRMCRDASEHKVCEVPGCGKETSEHATSWMHAGVRVRAVIKTVEQDRDGEEVEKILGGREGDGGRIDCWTECKETGVRGAVVWMSEAACSFSFAKYLELLIYADRLYPPGLNSNRSNKSDHIPPSSVLRHFRHGSEVVTFALDSIEIFEMRVPKLQLGPTTVPKSATERRDDEKRRDENKVKELEEEVNGFFSDLIKKYELCNSNILPPPHLTDRPAPESRLALEKLKDSFLRDQTNIIALIQQTSPGQINDARRHFADIAKADKAKMSGWEKKYGSPPDYTCENIEPDYMRLKEVHALPGSAVLVREDEPASIIAYTLSCMEYRREVGNPKANPFASIPSTPRFGEKEPEFMKSFAGLPPTPSNELPPEIMSDGDHASWYVPESWQTEVTRREHNREFSLMSLRNLPRKKSEAALGLTAPTPLAPKATLSKAVSNQPELFLGFAEGDIGVKDSLGSLVDSISKTTGKKAVVKNVPESNKDHPPSAFDRPLSVASIASNHSTSSGTSSPAYETSIHGFNGHSRNTTGNSTNSAVSDATVLEAPDTYLSALTPSMSRRPSNSNIRGDKSPVFMPQRDDSWGATLTTGLANSLSNILGMGSVSSRGGMTPKTESKISTHHTLLASDASGLPTEDKPHIQFSYTVGKRLKISCTVYYASAFESLRKRLGVERDFIESLMRTAKWNAEGGKTKSLFFKTKDDRFVVKELLTGIMANDTQALLEISPAYFDFINSTSSRPTALAKILGFYTIRINNLETSTVSKLDLLVMENIFFDQQVNRSFDLKGIEGRKVKSSAGLVGHDGDWIEGQQKTLLLVHPHSKRILQEAISSDSRFLSSNQIMDYSLLVGIDEKQKELAVGLVDAIGAFTFFKALESKGKQLTKGGDVTILPPPEYSNRFRTAMDSYFQSCPDKWSKPPSSSKEHQHHKEKDILSLPSIF